MAIAWDELLSRAAAALAAAATEADVRAILEETLSPVFPSTSAPFPLPGRAPLTLAVAAPADDPGVRTLAHLAASALDRIALKARADAADRENRILRDRFERLRSAGRAAVSSLDYAAVLEALPHVFVPALADWCTFKIVDPADGTAAHASALHVDPDRIDLLRAFALGPHGRLSDEVRHALARGEVVHREHLRDLLADPGEQETSELLGSAVVLGLKARGFTYGALALGRAAPHAWDAESLAMAEDVAQRAALAVDNARLYRDALAATRLRDDFLSIASHELRTPLTALNLDLQLATRTAHKLAISGVFPRRLDSAAKQVGRLVRLVGDLLDVSRLAAGRLELEPEETDAVELARTVASRFEAEAATLGTTIAVDAIGPLAARFDPQRLDQVLTNLVSNALKYGNSTPVTIRVDADDTRLAFAVRDDGLGVPEEAQTRIFERFTRAAPKGHAGGLGLGLWIVKEIVVAHRGTVRVESQPGAGTVFRVELPRWA